MKLQNGPEETVGQGVEWHVARFVECPVPGGKGASQHHFRQSRNEEETPKQTKKVVYLYDSHVKVSTRFEEFANGARTLTRTNLFKSERDASAHRILNANKYL